MTDGNKGVRIPKERALTSNQEVRMSYGTEYLCRAVALGYRSLSYSPLRSLLVGVDAIHA